MKVGIVGSGVNGICTAIALAERGCEVTVYERGAPFSETSARSSKMLHGGIRYLEKGHFKLVREALIDRAWWLKNASEHTRVSRFYIPVYKHSRRSFFTLFIGVKLYEYLSSSYSLGPSRFHGKKATLALNPLIRSSGLIGSVSYLDVQMDDHGLSGWLLDRAKGLGVRVLPNTPVTEISLQGEIVLTSGDVKTYDKVVNAAGPWAGKLLKDSGIESTVGLILIRGSHLVVNKVLENPLVFQSPIDGRIVFMLPHDNKTLIGTTEVLQDLNESITCTQDEIVYLLETVNAMLFDGFKESDIVDVYAGVRPIVRTKDDFSDLNSANRESLIEENQKLVSIYGGKWTSGIRLGKSVADLLLGSQ